MAKLNEDKISEVTIDFSKIRDKRIDESYLTQLGTVVGYALEKMFAGAGTLLNVRGTNAEIGAFLTALTAEKNYLQKFMQYGLGDKKTYESRYKLDSAVKNFERETGLKWPMK
tara:strand:- start:374 stop:712 length:339 start_codon:yes stop_codon:yes gene_type:complete